MYTLQLEKKSRGCVNALAVFGAIALAVIGMFVVLGVAVSTDSSANSYTFTRNVIYKITTNRDSNVWPSCYWFDVTYEMKSGTAQKSVSICDGKRSATVDTLQASYGDFVYLSVQNDKMAARIGCEIYVDGTLVHKTQSEGQYVIASCSGSVQ